MFPAMQARPSLVMARLLAVVMVCWVRAACRGPCKNCREHYAVPD